MNRGIVLFAHGSRDPEWALPLRRMAQLLAAQETAVNVQVAFLEHLQPSLETAVESLVASGVADVSVVPVFIAQGGHLKQDLPRIVDGIRKNHPQLVIRLAPPVGESEAVLQAMADYAVQAANPIREAHDT
jgi:sirohydrochlorin cobaltochelatase